MALYQFWSLHRIEEDCEGWARKRPWPIARYYVGIHTEKLRKNMKTCRTVGAKDETQPNTSHTRYALQVICSGS